MKFCQVALVLCLAGGWETAIEAQTLEAQTLAGNKVTAEVTVTAGVQDTVMVASGGVPAGLLPDLLAGSGSLGPGVKLTPEISQAMTVETAEPKRPLTRMDRLTLFLNDTYASPGAYAGLGAGALIDQVRHTPAKWDADGSGYTRRFASEYGQLAIRNSIHDGMAAMTGLDPRYPACNCSGMWHRSGHALEMTFVNHRQDGRLVLDMPQIASAYGSGMVSTYWYPHRQYTPLVQGVQFGHEQMGEILINNLVQEFASDLKRSLHLQALAALSHPRPDDDDD
ncbi:MAG: hypothetical protein WA510_06710 [Acidobacteriaceae bacterium]